ncbi:hypothetical protein TNCV_467481 [Trichonephila clavipes]|nr:hypothetical protein TNCV_467481 [Trichonephila clavipes]
MGAEFLLMDDNARPHRANIVDECLQSEDITRMDWPAYSPDSILFEDEDMPFIEGDDEVNAAVPSRLDFWTPLETDGNCNVNLALLL